MTLIPFLEAFEWLWSWAKKKKQVEPKKIPRILVVEDNADDSFLLSEHLEYCGKSATFVRNAEAAEAMIHRNNIDLIFVDLRLTYMNGWDLIPLVWTHSPHSIVVVICTMMEDLVNIPKPHKFFIVMSKPIQAEELCQLFETLKI